MIQNKTNINKTCATDSVGYVLGRFTNLFDTLAMDYAVFNDLGFVRPEMWNGVVEVMRIFLASQAPSVTWRARPGRTLRTRTYLTTITQCRLPDNNSGNG